MKKTYFKENDVLVLADTDGLTWEGGTGMKHSVPPGEIFLVMSGSKTKVMCEWNHPVFGIDCGLWLFSKRFKKIGVL